VQRPADRRTIDFKEVNAVPSVTLEDKSDQVDEEGFLRDPTIWTDEVARDLAALAGMGELTEDHWTVIHFLRGYYLQHGVPPMMWRVSSRTGLRLRELSALFPARAIKTACKVAGLPRT
jgi:dissimilatory sulfite reductase related protein